MRTLDWGARPATEEECHLDPPHGRRQQGIDKKRRFNAPIVCAAVKETHRSRDTPPPLADRAAAAFVEERNIGCLAYDPSLFNILPDGTSARPNRDVAWTKPDQ
jgi:hypothetical protein